MGAAARSGCGVAGGAQPAPRLRRAQCFDAGVSGAAAASRRPAAAVAGRPAGSRGAPKCRPPRIDPNHGTSPPRPAPPHMCRTVPHPLQAACQASVVKNMPSVRTDACCRRHAPYPRHALRRPRNARRHPCECLRLAPGRERKNTGAAAICHGRACPQVKAPRGAGRGAAPWRCRLPGIGVFEGRTTDAAVRRFPDRARGRGRRDLDKAGTGIPAPAARYYLRTHPLRICAPRGGLPAGACSAPRNARARTNCADRAGITAAGPSRNGAGGGAQ